VSTFKYKREGTRLFVRLDDPYDKWEALCTIEKSDDESWARYVLEQLQKAEAIQGCGLTTENILALARIYQATAEETPNK
jgi:hypothetical protein